MSIQLDHSIGSSRIKMSTINADGVRGRQCNGAQGIKFEEEGGMVMSSNQSRAARIGGEYRKASNDQWRHESGVAREL